MQLAAIIHRHTTVVELCYHAKLNSTLRQGSNTVDQTAVELEDRNTTVKLTGKKAQAGACGTTRFKFQNSRVDRLMRTKIRQDGANMVFPVMVSDSIRISMQNRSVEMGDRERIEVITLSARENFFGKQ